MNVEKTHQDIETFINIKMICVDKVYVVISSGESYDIINIHTYSYCNQYEQLQGVVLAMQPHQFSHEPGVKLRIE